MCVCVCVWERERERERERGCGTILGKTNVKVVGKWIKKVENTSSHLMVPEDVKVCHLVIIRQGIILVGDDTVEERHKVMDIGFF